jgi:predicted small secreted protein
MKRHLLCFSALLVALFVNVAGCHTADGVGKDVERAGEEIQDAVD